MKKKIAIIILTIVIAAAIPITISILTKDLSSGQTDKPTNAVEKTTEAQTTEKETEPPKPVGGEIGYLAWDKAQELNPDYFAETVFIGDSVSLKFKMYGGLPGASYLCYGSFGTVNALAGVIKENIWDDIGDNKRVYIMLGMNDLNPAGIDGAVANMKELCNRILDKNPDVLIYIQSMTPITKAHDGINGRLGKKYINEYNEKLLELAKENNWYYLDVASVLTTEDGYLKDEYCGDNGAEGMGLHLSNPGCAVWCDYLKNHCMDPSWDIK